MADALDCVRLVMELHTATARRFVSALSYFLSMWAVGT